MDKIGGGSIGPTLGLGRGKYKHNYPGPQAEAENNEYHRVPQRSTRHVEYASRANSCADI
jgi:hypothetical protein